MATTKRRVRVQVVLASPDPGPQGSFDYVLMAIYALYPVAFIAIVVLGLVYGGVS